MTSPAVATASLSKQFGQHKAVDGIDLLVPAGSVYGFLGPNGSGKTTTIRMLLGLIRPSNGTAEVLGHPIPADTGKALPDVGALAEGPAFHPYLSGRANLRRLDAADSRVNSRGAKQRIDEALERVGLSAAAAKWYRNYSLGMRQRLALAAALLRPRRLLILDEPTNGLDPQGTREVRNLIGQLAADGATVLVSSHLLGEVEQVATHLGIMRTGQLVAQGPVEELRSRGRRRIHLTTPDVSAARQVLAQLEADEVLVAEPSSLVAALETPTEAVVEALVAAQVRVRGVAEVSDTLEDLFIRLTGEGFEVSG